RHAGQSERALRRRCRPGRVEANAIVADLKLESAWSKPQPYPRLLSVGVLSDVGERLLHDPEQVQTDEIGYVDRRIGFECHLNPLAFLELIEVIAQGWYKAPLGDAAAQASDRFAHIEIQVVGKAAQPLE